MNLHQIIRKLPVLALLWIAGCSEPPPMLKAELTHRYSQEVVIDALLSSDATLSAIVTANQQVSVHNNLTQQPVQIWQPKRFTFKVYHLALSGDKKVIGTAGHNTVALWDANSGQSVATWPVRGFDQDSKVSKLLIDRTAAKVLVGMSEGSVLSFDLKQNKQSMFAIHQGAVNHLLLTDDGRNVVSGSTDGVVAYWQGDNGKILHEIEQRFRVTCLAMSQVSQKVFVSDALGEQFIWNLRNNQKTIELDYFERWRWFREAIFTEQGSLITSSPKRDITLWDVDSGKPLKLWRIKGFSSGSTTYSMALNGQDELLTLSSDAVLQRWDYRQ